MAWLLFILKNKNIMKPVDPNKASEVLQALFQVHSSALPGSLIKSESKSATELYKLVSGRSLPSHSLKAFLLSGSLESYFQNVKVVPVKPRKPASKNTETAKEDKLESIGAEPHKNVDDLSTSSSNYSLAYPLSFPEVDAKSPLNNSKVTNESGVVREQSTDIELGSGMQWLLWSSLVLGGLSFGGLIVYLLMQGDDRDQVIGSGKTENLSGDEVKALSGNVIIGPLAENHGLKVEVYSANDQLIGTAEVDADGRYALEIPGNLRTVKVVVSDTTDSPDVRHDVTGELVNVGLNLVAVKQLGLSKTEELHVNYLTTLSSWLMNLNKDGTGLLLDLDLVTYSNRAISLYFLGNHAIDLTSYDVQSMFDVDGTKLVSNEGGVFQALLAFLEQEKSITKAEIMDLLVQAFDSSPTGIFSDASLYSAFDDTPEFVEVNFDATLRNQVDAYLNNLRSYIDDQANLLQGNVIYLKEDATHVFDEEDLLFLGPTIKEAVTSITITDLPNNGYLRFDGIDLLEPGLTVPVNEISKLSYKGRSNDYGTNYARIGFTFKAGEQKSTVESWQVNIEDVNDTPDIFVETALPELYEKPKLLHSNVSGNQRHIVISETFNDEFLTFWIDKDESAKLAQFGNGEIYSLDALVEEKLITSANSSKVIFDTLFASANNNGGSVVAVSSFEESEKPQTLLTFLNSSHESLKEISIGSEQTVLGLKSLVNGDVVIGKLIAGSLPVLALTIYSSSGELKESIDITSFSFGSQAALALTPLSSGGFAVAYTYRLLDGPNTFRVDEYSAEGQLVQRVLSRASIEPDYVQGMELVQFEDKTLALGYIQDNKLELSSFGSDSADLSMSISPDNQKELSSYQLTVTQSGFHLLWVESNEAEQMLYGQYFDVSGKALSSKEIIHALFDGYQFTQLDAEQLPNEQLHIVWTEEGRNAEDSFMLMSNARLLTHNIQESLKVAEVTVTDVETDIASLQLIDDAGGLFELDTETNEIWIANYRELALSEKAEFAISLRATDLTGITETLNYTIQFPGSEKGDNALSEPILAGPSSVVDSASLYSEAELDMPIAATIWL